MSCTCQKSLPYKDRHTDIFQKLSNCVRHPKTWKSVKTTSLNFFMKMCINLSYFRRRNKNIIIAPSSLIYVNINHTNVLFYSKFLLLKFCVIPCNRILDHFTFSFFKDFLLIFFPREYLKNSEKSEATALLVDRRFTKINRH